MRGGVGLRRPTIDPPWMSRHTSWSPSKSAWSAVAGQADGWERMMQTAKADEEARAKRLQAYRPLFEDQRATKDRLHDTSRRATQQQLTTLHRLLAANDTLKLAAFFEAMWEMYKEARVKQHWRSRPRTTKLLAPLAHSKFPSFETLNIFVAIRRHGYAKFEDIDWAKVAEEANIARSPAQIKVSCFTGPSSLRLCVCPRRACFDRLSNIHTKQKQTSIQN